MGRNYRLELHESDLLSFGGFVRLAVVARLDLLGGLSSEQSSTAVHAHSLAETPHERTPVQAAPVQSLGLGGKFVQLEFASNLFPPNVIQASGFVVVLNVQRQTRALAAGTAVASGAPAVVPFFFHFLQKIVKVQRNVLCGSSSKGSAFGIYQIAALMEVFVGVIGPVEGIGRETRRVVYYIVRHCGVYRRSRNRFVALYWTLHIQ